MRSPDLNISFVLAMMRQIPSESGMAEEDYVETVSVALLNPNLIERSRRQGRSWYLVFGDGNPPMEEFAEIWELAATTWSSRNPVPYRVFAFLQTKVDVKLNIYRKLRGQQNEIFREAIMSGCEPLEDRELLNIGLSEERDSIKEIAFDRCGDYLKYVQKFRTRKKHID
jgi:hypothetical protein